MSDQAPPRRLSAPHDRPVRPARAPSGPRKPKTVHDPAPSHHDAAVQAPVDEPQKHAPPSFVAPPPLVPPPPVAFDSTPIPWKGLPLDAAQWTFSSSEFQEIVSKAIRLSARDSFVRLLSLQALEVDLVHESERLHTARLEAQAKWRFEVGRRTMLVQALNASAAQPDHPDPIAGLVGQLASTIASCDSLLSTILQISDQQSQIDLIQHQHWSSALGVALRKLNKAHERQTVDLRRAQARVQTLEDELDEAWREAENMAIEFDDLEQEIAESDTSDVVPHDFLDPKLDLDETGTLGDVTIHTDIAVVLGVTATAVASKATLVTSSASLVPSSPPPPISPPLFIPPESDTRSIRSVKSTRSKRSTRDGPTHLARLSSARTRSRAASNASLRLPKSIRMTMTPSTHVSPVDAPPMPALPLASVPADSFLDMDNRSHEHLRKVSAKRQNPSIALPTPPHSAGLAPPTVPSILVEEDGSPTRQNTLDRAHSFQIFSSLTPLKMRRSNLVMSLTGERERSRSPGSSSASASASGSGSGSSTDQMVMSITRNANGTETTSPTSTYSPVSLPTIALTHFMEPSSPPPSLTNWRGRPGSAGARLTTTPEEANAHANGSASLRTTGRLRRRHPPTTPTTPRKSLVSRASSVLLRRLSQATVGTGAGSGPGVGGGRVTAMASRGAFVSPSKRGRWKDRSAAHAHANGNGAGADGEVMLIGSPHVDSETLEGSMKT